MDRLDLLQKLLTQLCGLNFCINYNSSARFDPSIVKQRNGPKCSQTLRNKTKHEFRVQWGWISCIHCEKFGHDFVAWTFTLIAPVQPILHRVSCRNEMVPNARKHYKNTTKRWVSGPMGWIRCVHCENIPHNFAARTYALIAPVWPILHWVYCRNKNNPKCTQTLRNATKDEFRVQLGGLDAFVVKTSNSI